MLMECGGSGGGIKYKDLTVQIPNANTWYSYDYSADNDLKDATIISLFFTQYRVSSFGNTQVNLNEEAKKIWFGSTISTSTNGNTLRVAYIP